MDIGVQIEFIVTPQLANPSSPQFGEWPPAPDRVFQALVAAAAETGQDMEVLRYLESAPAIEASSAVITKAPRQYVPENFRRSDKYHQGAARYLPVVKPESPTVTYIWSNIPEDTVGKIRSIVDQVTHVGRASSFVRAVLVDHQTCTATLLPTREGELLLRTPHPGRLSELCEAYSAGLRSPVPDVFGYRYAKDCQRSGPWQDLMVLKTGHQIDITKTVFWTERLRRAVMSKAPNEMPGLIHGHDDHRHVAWTALPDVGHKYGSGRIIGLGCWLPSNITNQERGLLGSIFMNLSEVNGLKLEIDPSGLKGLQAHTWSRASKMWATVTPIALDRWPKKNRLAEEIVSQSLEEMNFPKPVKILCSNYSPITKAAYARQYPSRKGNKFITHAIIEWEEPVVGPILIGADRYFGSGLCRPIA